MNTLAYMLIGLGAVALWHFVYEAIILPTVRQDLRFKLYGLRDKLRELKTEHNNQISHTTFDLLDASLSWQIDNQHKLTCSLLNRTNQLLKTDPEFAEKVKNRVQAIEECRLPEYADILKARAELFKEAVIFNSMGWAIYLVPVVACAVGMGYILETTKVWVGMSEREFDELTPCEV